MQHPLDRRAFSDALNVACHVTLRMIDSHVCHYSRLGNIPPTRGMQASVRLSVRLYVCPVSIRKSETESRWKFKLAKRYKCISRWRGQRSVIISSVVRGYMKVVGDKT